MCVASGSVELHVTNWKQAQREDPVLSTMLDWLEFRKKTELKTFLGEHASGAEGCLVLRNQQNFTIHPQNLLYLCSTPKGESKELLPFVVP